MGKISVTKGMEDSVDAVVKEETAFLVKKDDGKEWETKTEILPFVAAPVEKGEKVGELLYLINGETVGSTDLVAEDTVEKADIGTMLERMLKLWF